VIQSEIENIERLARHAAPLFARKELEVAVSEEEIEQLIEDEGKGNAFAGCCQQSSAC
jgi:hypothetical protein